MNEAWLWLLLAVGAQILFAAAIYVDKYTLATFSPDPGTAALASSALNLIVAVGLLVWRGPVDGGWTDNTLLLGSGAVFAVGLVFYFKALALADASAVSPLFQFFPIWVLLIAVVLGDKVSSASVIGIGITVASGAMFLAAAGGGRVLQLRLVFLMLSSCLFLGVQATMIDRVLTRHSFADALGMILAGGAVAGLVGLLAVPRTSESTFAQLGIQGLVALLVAEVLSLAADVLLIAALAAGPVVLVALTTSLEPLALFALGAILTAVGPAVIRESIDRRTVAWKLAGCALAVVGVAVPLLL